MTLRQRLWLAFFFVVIIPIVLLGMIIIELMVTRSDESIANIVEHEWAMAQARYQQQGETVKQGVMLTAGQLDVRQAISNKDKTFLQQRLQDWRSVYPQVDLWLIVDSQEEILAQLDTDGVYTFSSPPLSYQLSQTLTSNEASISTELLTAPDSNAQRMVQAVIVPVQLQNGFTGAIMAIDRLDNNQWTLPPQAGLYYGGAESNSAPLNPLFFITQQDKIIAVFPAGLPPAQLLTPEIEEAIQIALNNGWGLIGQGEMAGETYQLSGKPIIDSQNQIIGSFFVGLPYKKYFGLQAQASWIVTGMLVMSAIISLIVASIIASAITQPIQSLSEKSGELAQGNLSVRASVSGQDEIAQLGHAFNKMAANLEQSYEELETERRRALAIIEASADGIWVVNKEADGHRRVAMVNSALERMVGRSRDKLVAQRCSGLMGVCDLAGKLICRTQCPFIQSYDQPAIVHGLLPNGGDDRIPVEISYGRLTNQQGELTGLVHIMRDLTLRREVERLKADFISMVSHELRTPLGHIKGFATSLLQTDVTWDIETEHDFLNGIDREADRLTKLVENLLQMSRIEAGGLKRMERHIHQLNELLDQALPELRRRANEHILIVNLPDKLAAKPIAADARGIEMVLANLVENAAKYSPPRAKITLSIEDNGEGVIFSVQDEGAGVPLAERKHIFDQFYRSKTIRRNIRGTGLGLAICKRIVEAHGGQIWVDGSPDSGACFSFKLPVG